MFLVYVFIFCTLFYVIQLCFAKFYKMYSDFLKHNSVYITYREIGASSGFALRFVSIVNEGGLLAIQNEQESGPAMKSGAQLVL